MKSKYIIHIADLHIGSGRRSAEYRQVFDQLGVHIKAYDAIIVIAGDIFHNKTTYTGDDVDDFDYLCNVIGDRTTIIIPGNHDANLNDKQALDLLTPLIKRKNFHYWKESGMYQLCDIEFYHVSVFDESTTEQILESIEGDDGNTILLYHGFIAGAKFANRVVRDSESRITSTVLDRFKITIAGDIHNQHFIRPNVGYSGSLIQQNVAESIVKGFVLWDLTTNTGEFVRIINTYGHVRVDLRGKNKTESADIIASMYTPDKLLRVALITDADDTSEQVELMKTRFGKLDRVNQVMKRDTPVINDTAETLRELLTAAGATESQIEEITTAHAHTAIFKCAKWTINSLCWDNFFKYGPTNYIDFNSIEGISGVIAANRAGKSSIIDILMFGLYGELLRGDKKSMINHNAKSASVRVDFTVNGTKYFIARTDVRNISHANIMLCRYEDSWVNITGVSTTETYIKIKDLIGTSSQFLSTGLYYDAINDIIRMTGTDRMKILPNIFGLVNNETQIRDLKIKMREIKLKIDALIKPRMDKPKELLEIAQTDLDEHNELLICYTSELDDLNKNYDDAKQKYAGIRPRNELLSDLVIHTCHRDTLIEKLKNKVELVVSYAEKVICNDITIKLSNETIPSVHRDQLTQINIQKPHLVDLCTREKLQSLQDEHDLIMVVELPYSMTILNDEFVNIKYSVQQSDHIYFDSLRKQIVDTNKQIDEYSLWLEQHHTIADIITIDTCELLNATAELDQLRSRTTLSVIQQHRNQHDVSNLQTRVSKLQDQNRLKFSQTCDCCAGNRVILAGDLDTAIKELESELNTNSEICIYNRSVDEHNQSAVTEINNLNKRIADMSNRIRILQTDHSLVTQRNAETTTLIKRRDDFNNRITTSRKLLIDLQSRYDDCVRICKSINDENARNREIETIIRTKMTCLNENNERATRKHNLMIKIQSYLIQCEQYEQYIIEYEQYKKNVIEYKILSEQLDKLNAINAAKIIVREAYLYDQYKMRLDHDEMNRQLDTHTSMLEILNKHIVLSNDTHVNIISEYKKLIDVMFADIASVHKKVGSLSETIISLTQEITIHDEFNKQFPVLTALYGRHKLHADCLGSAGLRAAVIRKNITRVTSSVNEILKSVSDFTIEYVLSDTSIDFTIVELNNQSIPLSLGSGFQKFIISLSFRIALTSMIPSSSEFIIIDEGFGCMDNENMGKLAEFFSLISTAYKFIFIVTHVPQLQSSIVNPMYILETHGRSSITYGMIPIDDGPKATRIKPKKEVLIAIEPILIEPILITPILIKPILIEPILIEPILIAPLIIPIGSVACECGIIVKKTSLALHKKTDKHKKKIGI